MFDGVAELGVGTTGFGKIWANLPIIWGGFEQVRDGVALIRGELEHVTCD